MTRRERLEHRAERRREWAAGRERKAERHFGAADQIAHAIPLGQPVLVGHHSEKHHRRDLARIDSNMAAGVESHKMAERHADRASGIERQLDRSIFDDDPDAIEQLEARIAKREAARERGKRINAAWRQAGKPDPLDPEAWEKFTAAVGPTDAARAADGLRYQRRADVPGLFSFAKPYDPAHDGANIRRDRERIEQIRRQQTRSQEAEAAGGVAIQRFPDANWCRVTFAEKPERAILDALRAADYGWGNGSWQGHLDRLPPEVER